MRLRVTRLVLLVVATIGLWACTCPGPEDEIFLLRDPDAATQALIDRCLDPTLKDCLPLCEKVSGQTAIVHCEIHVPTDPAFVQVHVGFTPFCGGNGD
jgi:hypothetical protein